MLPVTDRSSQNQWSPVCASRSARRTAHRSSASGLRLPTAHTPTTCSCRSNASRNRSPSSSPLVPVPGPHCLSFTDATCPLDVVAMRPGRRKRRAYARHEKASGLEAHHLARPVFPEIERFNADASLPIVSGDLGDEDVDVAYVIPYADWLADRATTPGAPAANQKTDSSPIRCSHMAARCAAVTSPGAGEAGYGHQERVRTSRTSGTRGFGGACRANVLGCVGVALAMVCVCTTAHRPCQRAHQSKSCEGDKRERPCPQWCSAVYKRFVHTVLGHSDTAACVQQQHKDEPRPGTGRLQRGYQGQNGGNEQKRRNDLSPLAR